LLLFLFLKPAYGQDDPLPHQNFESTLQSAIHACAENQFTSAHRAFQDLESIFGREPEFQNPQIQKAILPLWGYAALISEDFPAAIEHLSAYIHQFPEHSKKQAFAQFTLAQAFQAAQRFPEAIDAYQLFTRNFAQKPESGIAQLRIAELYITLDQAEKALATFDHLFHSNHTPTLRLQARLRSLQIAIAHEQWALATECLIQTDWDLETLPDRYSLTIAALHIGDHWLQQNRPDDAIAAYRFVPSKDQLIHLQRLRLATIQDHFNRRSRSLRESDAGIWAEYYRSLLSQLKNLLQSLESSDDYTPAFLLRYGQAFAQANRHYEAWLIYESIANDTTLDDPTRQEAHYRQIVCIQQLGQWSDALIVAQSYAKAYPESPRSPLVLYLTANALQQLQRSREAIDILDRIMTTYPSHPACSRWLFTRGFNYLLLDEFSTARADFTEYTDRFANQTLATNARLWQVLTFFFEKKYAIALEALDPLIKATPEDHYLQAEMHYRRGSILYALRRFEPALDQINQYLAHFPQDHHHAEALVLRGDILMGLGRLLEAALAFRQVGPEAQTLYAYSVFQIGKIYRATEDYDRLADYFTEYLDQPDSTPILRVAEALYWIGWAREKQGRLLEAFPSFLQAIERYGNDPQATGIQDILTGLHRIHRQIHDNSAITDLNHALLATPQFIDWIDLQSEDALAHRQLTYYARLAIYKAERLKASKQYAAAEQIYLNLGESVPLINLDAEALGLIGMAQWENKDPKASESFTLLLHNYPKSAARIDAWIGLGQIAFQSEDWSQVIDWLQPVVQSYLTHPLAPKAALLYTSALQSLDQRSQAKDILHDILKLKSARGRPHAEALLQLADIAKHQEEASKAIAYYQRVYNLYRASPDLVVFAYFESARLFEKLGNLHAAFNTYVEMLQLASFEKPINQTRAQQERDRLQPLISTDNASSHSTSKEVSSS